MGAEQTDLPHQLSERAGLVGNLVPVPSDLPGALFILLIILLPAPANSSSQPLPQSGGLEGLWRKAGQSCLSRAWHSGATVGRGLWPPLLSGQIAFLQGVLFQEICNYPYKQFYHLLGNQ